MTTRLALVAQTFAAAISVEFARGVILAESLHLRLILHLHLLRTSRCRCSLIECAYRGGGDPRRNRAGIRVIFKPHGHGRHRACERSPRTDRRAA